MTMDNRQEGEQTVASMKSEAVGSMFANSDSLVPLMCCICIMNALEYTRIPKACEAIVSSPDPLPISSKIRSLTDQ